MYFLWYLLIGLAAGWIANLIVKGGGSGLFVNLIVGLIGGILGGLWMIRLGINRALWVFGVVQLVSIFGFAWLAWLGPQLAIGAEQRLALAGVIGLEALGVGLGTAAFVAFIARSTHPSYTATQFALFTSLAAVPRTFINATTGYLIEWLGYVSFFWACFFLAVPGMLLLFWVAPWNGDNKPATPADKAEAA